MNKITNWKKISDNHTIALGALLVSNFIIKYTRINDFIRLIWCLLVLYTIIMVIYGVVKGRQNKQL